MRCVSEFFGIISSTHSLPPSYRVPFSLRSLSPITISLPAVSSTSVQSVDPPMALMQNANEASRSLERRSEPLFPLREFINNRDPTDDGDRSLSICIIPIVAADLYCCSPPFRRSTLPLAALKRLPNLPRAASARREVRLKLSNHPNNRELISCHWRLDYVITITIRTLTARAAPFRSEGAIIEIWLAVFDLGWTD